MNGTSKSQQTFCPIHYTFSKTQKKSWSPPGRLWNRGTWSVQLQLSWISLIAPSNGSVSPFRGQLLVSRLGSITAPRFTFEITPDSRLWLHEVKNESSRYFHSSPRETIGRREYHGTDCGQRFMRLCFIAFSLTTKAFSQRHSITQATEWYQTSFLSLSLIS